MAEKQAVDAQENDSQAQQEDSTFGRLKSRVKDLVGKDSEEESNGAEAKGEGSSEAEGSAGEGDEGSGDAEAKGEAEDGEQASSEGGEEGDSEVEDDSESTEAEGESGGYDLDDVDPSDPTEDDDLAQAQIDKLERDGPPENLGDWPTGKAMYLTFGGAEGEATYEEAASAQLGPSSTRHHADGSVEVQGEMVDDASPYKGEKSVFDEADEIGMDKGAKTGGDEEEGDDSGEGESSGGEEGSSEESSESESSQSESSEETRSESEASQSDEADGDEAASQGNGGGATEGSRSEGSAEGQSEGETAERS
jgi:hypothetical protein